MATVSSDKVTLHGGIQHLVKTDDVLVIAEDCFDISDKALMARKIKQLSKGELVIVKDLYHTEMKSFRAIRAYHNKTLFYLAACNLKTIQSV